MIEIDVQKKLMMVSDRPGEPTMLSVNTKIDTGSLVALYGKSGAGKTTLLRIIAGLTEPDRGRIAADARPWLDTDRKIRLPVQKRKIGFVFQHAALFPNMTVKENLYYALKPSKDKQWISRLLDMVELGQMADRKPHTLSGGQTQRIALIQALVKKPTLLLLDEPFSALDAEMRSSLQEQIIHLHREFHLTTVLVSHDHAEVERMTDRVIQIDLGKIIYEGKPPKTFNAMGVNDQVEIRGRVKEVAEIEGTPRLTIALDDATIELKASDRSMKAYQAGDNVSMSFSRVALKKDTSH